jgi:hypothetical protein
MLFWPTSGMVQAGAGEDECPGRSLGSRSRSLPHHADDIERLQPFDHRVRIGQMVIEHSDRRPASLAVAASPSWSLGIEISSMGRRCDLVTRPKWPRRSCMTTQPRLRAWLDWRRGRTRTTASGCLSTIRALWFPVAPPIPAGTPRCGFSRLSASNP